MKQDLDFPKKAVLKPTVLANQPVGPCFYRMELIFNGGDAEIIKQALPGQFAELRVDNLAFPEKLPVTEKLFNPDRRPMLRRPFSFSSVREDSRTGQTVGEILYCVLGSATARMTTVKTNDIVDMIAPLGSSFTVSEQTELAILTAGGMGAAPLQFLSEYLACKHPRIRQVVFVGAKLAAGFPFFHVQQQLREGKVVSEVMEFSRNNAETMIATDDGSAGYKGFVTGLMEKWLKDEKPDPQKTVVYTCGPEPMMAATADIAKENNLKCQASLERVMACGIGLCQGCAVKYRDPKTGGQQYKLCCKDGPVFDAAEVIWEHENA